MSKIKFKHTFLGTHSYSKCPFDEVGFLRNEHHHDFTIHVECSVIHDDRDLEWIMLRVELMEMVESSFEVNHKIVRFAERSCEMIAEEVKKYFVGKYGDRHWKVSVSEDETYIGGDW